MTLLDWRRRVAARYADVRAGADTDPVGSLARFRAAREQLFREHPDTPLGADRPATFAGLAWWPHDPAMRFEVPVEPLPPLPAAAASLTGDTCALTRIGRVRLPIVLRVRPALELSARAAVQHAGRAGARRRTPETSTATRPAIPAR
jgi:uncharacterized protein (DUF1684 family)